MPDRFPAHLLIAVLCAWSGVGTRDFAIRSSHAISGLALAGVERKAMQVCCGVQWRMAVRPGGEADVGWVCVRRQTAIELWVGNASCGPVLSPD